jgi:mono/diheme cytochrome c family protein
MASPSFADELSEAAYVVRTSGCADCHTATESEPFAGGYKIVTPFGNFYSGNITPDAETGIGKWTERDLRRALRFGRSPSGRPYYPVFPYRSYTKLTNQDIHKIYIYLMSLQPVRKRNREPYLSWFRDQRSLLYVWNQFAFSWSNEKIDEQIKSGMGAFKPDPIRTAKWNRGGYLAEAMLHCAECHTPRSYWLQIPENNNWMAGTSDALSDTSIPNITPDPTTGITWTEEEWEIFLSSGFNPKLKQAANEMADVVRNTSNLTKDDRAALIEYLRSLEPVEHYSQ